MKGHKNTPESIIAQLIPEPNTGCWLWAGNLGHAGYGRASLDMRSRKTHRLVYEALRGPIAPGLEIDHKCRVRCCANPDHLEPVTGRENRRRAALLRTTCSRGHSFDSMRRDGARHCRQCGALRQRRYRHKARNA